MHSENIMQAIQQNTEAVNRMAQAFHRVVDDLDRYRKGYKEQKQRAERLQASYTTLKGHMTRKEKENKRLRCQIKSIQFQL